MSRKLILTLSAMVAAAAASTTLGATQALAHYPYRACIVADYGFWLYPQHPYMCEEGWRCGRRIRGRRAFRVMAQDGEFLFVSDGWTRGWIEISSVRIAPQAVCWFGRN